MSSAHVGMVVLIVPGGAARGLPSRLCAIGCGSCAGGGTAAILRDMPAPSAVTAGDTA